RTFIVSSALFTGRGREDYLTTWYFRFEIMRLHHDRFEVRTSGKGLYEITDELQAKLDRSDVRSGTITVFAHHTSCSIVVMENADPTARRDLEEFFERLVPEDANYFTHGSEG